jgi:alpha-N-arabinofuranosidase
MFAALTPDHRFLNVAVVNATEMEQTFHLDITGMHLDGPSVMWQLTGKDLRATDRVGETPQVSIHKIAIGNNLHSVSVAPVSIDVYRFPVSDGPR